MGQDKNDLFHSIYNQYYRALRSIARREGVPYDEIDDVVQESFFAYFRYYLEQEIPEGGQEALLARIVKNKCYDYFRRCSRRPSTAVDMDEYLLEMDETEELIERNVLDVVVEKEYYRQIRECLLKMKPALREILILLVVQERTTEEVCHLLGITTAACYTRLSRARKDLTKRMERAERDAGKHRITPPVLAIAGRRLL